MFLMINIFKLTQQQKFFDNYLLLNYWAETFFSTIILQFQPHSSHLQRRKNIATTEYFLHLMVIQHIVILNTVKLSLSNLNNLCKNYFTLKVSCPKLQSTNSFSMTLPMFSYNTVWTHSILLSLVYSKKILKRISRIRFIAQIQRFLQWLNLSKLSFLFSYLKCAGSLLSTMLPYKSFKSEKLLRGEMRYERGVTWNYLYMRFFRWPFRLLDLRYKRDIPCQVANFFPFIFQIFFKFSWLVEFKPVYKTPKKIEKANCPPSYTLLKIAKFVVLSPEMPRFWGLWFTLSLAEFNSLLCSKFLIHDLLNAHLLF